MQKKYLYKKTQRKKMIRKTAKRSIEKFKKTKNSLKYIKFLEAYWHFALVLGSFKNIK